MGLFTGRGDTSTPLGLLFAYPDAPPPSPATVTTLPVGRRLLTATTEHDYRAGLVAFATAWRAAGFGDTVRWHSDPPPDLAVCPPATGEHTGLWTGTAYTFDDGQVLYYIPHRRDRDFYSGQWHTITLTTNPRGASCGTAVDLTPATRRYGTSYPDSADLDLPGLAVWLMADLTALGRTDTSAVWPYVRYAAAVNTARAEIALYLYGLDDTPGVRREPTDHDDLAFDEITAIALAHGWTNPQDAWDRRFELLLHIVGEHDSPEPAQPRKGAGNGHPDRRWRPSVDREPIMSTAVVAVDVDGVLAVDPAWAGGEHALLAVGYLPYLFDGLGPDGTPAAGTVWLNTAHSGWLRELLDHGAELVWATSWGVRAAEWIAPRLGLPEMPVIEVAQPRASVRVVSETPVDRGLGGVTGRWRGWTTSLAARRTGGLKADAMSRASPR